MAEQWKPKRKQNLFGAARLEREQADAAAIARQEAAELEAQEKAAREAAEMEAQKLEEQKEQELLEKKAKRSTGPLARLWGNFWYAVGWLGGLIIVFGVASAFATMVANNPDGVAGAVSELSSIVGDLFERLF